MKHMKRMKQAAGRLLSFLLVLVLVAGMLPATALAEGSQTEITDEEIPFVTENEANTGDLGSETTESDAQIPEIEENGIPDDETEITDPTEPGENGNSDETTATDPAEEGELVLEEEGQADGGMFGASVSENVEINEATFPDDGFRSYVKAAYDVNKDGKLNPSEIKGVTEMDLSGSDYAFESLEGIRYFTELSTLVAEELGLKELNVSGMENLEYLSCDYNQLTNLDVSGCTNLEYLFCDYNQLTSLDVSGCTNLEVLSCFINQLTSLDENICKQLDTLYCDYNPLTTLDLNGNTNLVKLYCSNAQLTSLNVGGCTKLSELDCSYNQLTALNLNNLTALIGLRCSSNQLSSLQLNNCTSLQTLLCTDNQLVTLNVGGRTSLKSLSCDNNKISMLQVSGCTGLKTLSCKNNYLSSLPSDGLDSLETLNCSSNRFTALNPSAYPSLRYLDCNDNQLTSLDVSGCEKLLELYCKNNKLSTLDVSSSRIVRLSCSGNQLTQLKLKSGFLWLDCSDNQLTALDLSDCKSSLQSVNCANNKLTALDVKNARNLWKVVCSGNQLTDLDVSGCTGLQELLCENNLLTVLDVSTCSELYTLCCSNNRLTSLDVSSCENLAALLCTGNQYQVEMKSQRIGSDIEYYLDLSGLPAKGFDRNKSGNWFDVTNETLIGRKPTKEYKLFVDDTSTRKVTYQYDCGGGWTASFTLRTDAVTTTPETGVAIDEEHFPDQYFRSFLDYLNCDLNDDDLLSASELERVTEMDISWGIIKDLTGIEYFTSLVTLTIDGTYEELNLTNLPKLKTLEFVGDAPQADVLKISDCTSLETLKCSDISLRSLQVIRCPNLTYLECENNPLVSVKLAGLNSAVEAKGIKTTGDSPCKIPATEIEPDTNNRFNLSTLPGFEIAKASGWNGGTVSGNTLTVTDGSGEVRYLYACGMGITVEMTLKAGAIEGLWISSVADQLYTGKAIKPQVEVYNGEKKLTAGKDYTISYKNNTNAAAWDAVDSKGRSIAPTIIVKGKGNYTGTATKTFTITPINLTKRRVDANLQSLLTIEPVYAKYTGKVIKGKPVIKFRGKTLSSKLYTLEYNDTADGSYKEEGAYTITIKGKGPNVTGSCTVKEYISANVMSKVSISLEKTSVPYDTETGITHPGVITVMNGSTQLYAGTDFYVDYLNDDRIGTATVVITGNEAAGWYGVKTKTYKITGTKLTGKMITQQTKSFVYNKERHYISDEDYTITYGGVPLVKDKDYIITYPGAEKTYTNPGTFKVTFTGIGAYSGSVTKTWTINKVSLTILLAEDNLKISYSGAEYTKGGAKAEISRVKAYLDEGGSVILTEGVDYTVTYVNNGKVADEDAAKAPYFYLTGKGGYTGNTKSAPCKYTIYQADIGESATIMAEDILYKDKKGNFVSSVSVVDNVTGKKLSSGTDYEKTLSYQYFDGTTWVPITTAERVDASGSRVKISVTVTGKGNYKGTLTDTYEVYPKTINTGSVVVTPIPTQTYTGKAITPVPEVRLKVKEGKTYTYYPLTEGVDYTVKYSKNVQKGTATIYLYGKGIYGGVKKVTFKIASQQLKWWERLW